MATVLVADDEAPLATLLRLILEQEQHTVLVAHSGQEALRLAREQRPDLALIDLMLQLLDGPQLCLRLHAEREIAAMPVILMSAARPVDWQACGAVDFLRKPFDIARVPALVRRHGSLTSAIPLRRADDPHAA